MHNIQAPISIDMRRALDKLPILSWQDNRHSQIVANTSKNIFHSTDTNIYGTPDTYTGIGKEPPNTANIEIADST